MVIEFEYNWNRLEISEERRRKGIYIGHIHRVVSLEIHRIDSGMAGLDEDTQDVERCRRCQGEFGEFDQQQETSWE